jgi:hypothetical protein
MPLVGTLFQFTPFSVSLVPEQAGVYCLFDATGVIYYGKSDARTGVRGRLQAHLSGSEGYCTASATAFQYELCSNPEAREGALLQEFRLLYGRLPRCNDVIPRASRW